VKDCYYFGGSEACACLACFLHWLFLFFRLIGGFLVCFLGLWAWLIVLGLRSFFLFLLFLILVEFFWRFCFRPPPVLFICCATLLLDFFLLFYLVLLGCLVCFLLCLFRAGLFWLCGLPFCLWRAFRLFWALWVNCLCYFLLFDRGWLFSLFCLSGL